MQVERPEKRPESSAATAGSPASTARQAEKKVRYQIRGKQPADQAVKKARLEEVSVEPVTISDLDDVEETLEDALDADEEFLPWHDESVEENKEIDDLKGLGTFFELDRAEAKKLSYRVFKSGLGTHIDGLMEEGEVRGEAVRQQSLDLGPEVFCLHAFDGVVEVVNDVWCTSGFWLDGD